MMPAALAPAQPAAPARIGSLPLLAVAALLGAVLLPLLLLDVPPLADYPNHLARIALLAGQAPGLASHFTVQWGILPNLAMDLLVPPLLSVMPLHVAGRLFVALAAVVPVLGVVAYHRAVFGPAGGWWPWAAALLAWNGVLLMGFVNFTIGTGLALLVAAAWIRLSPTRPLAALAVLALGGAAVFFCHLVATAFLFLLVATHETGRLWEERAQGMAALRRYVLHGVLAVVAALPVAALYLSAPVVEGPYFWGQPWERVERLLVPFAAYHAWWDLLAAALVGLAVAGLLLTGRARLHPGSVLAVLACMALYALVPTQISGGSYLELRFNLFAALLVFAGMQPRLAPVADRGLALGAAALLALRLGLLAVAWQGAARDLAEMRAAVATLPPGARLATVQVERSANHAYFHDQTARRLLSFFWFPTHNHAGAVVALERDAFWPSLFAIPGQQPIAAGGTYGDFNSTQWHAIPARTVLDPAAPPPPRIPADLLAPWRGWEARFDHVLVLHARAAGDAARFLPERLELVADTGFAALYRVRR